MFSEIALRRATSKLRSDGYRCRACLGGARRKLCGVLTCQHRVERRVLGLSVAVLSPVVSAMERRLGWSRGWCSTVLVLAIVLVIGVVALILVQAISGSVRGFSDDLPQIVDKARHSDLGSFINRGSDSLETLRKHASEIANGVGKVSGGVAHVGASAFGAVALVFSVVFLTLFGLVDEPRWRDWIGSLLYRDKRKRYLRVTDRVIHTTSR